MIPDLCTALLPMETEIMLGFNNTYIIYLQMDELDMLWQMALYRVEELKGDVREGVKAQSHYNDSLVAVQRERDDLKQRVDYCNKNARREITRLREELNDLRLRLEASDE